LPDRLGPLIRDLDCDEDQRLADWFAARALFEAQSRSMYKAR
jgi:hypothetical protein